MVTPKTLVKILCRRSTVTYVLQVLTEILKKQEQLRNKRRKDREGEQGREIDRWSMKATVMDANIKSCPF